MRTKILIIFFLFLANCNYSAIYKKTEVENLMINILSSEGDVEINNYINEELRPYTRKNAEKKFDIKIDTNFSKGIISKSSKGKVLNYELSVTSKFIVIYKNEEKIIILSEKLNIESNKDSFEQKNYEVEIKKNFANSIKEKLVLRLSNIQ